MSGYAGDVASKKLYKENAALFKERFSSSFIKMIEDLPGEEQANVSYEAETSEVCLKIEDGVYQTLWRLGEILGTGLEVEHKSIPIKQETIEVCEVLEINPYEIRSSGVIYVLPEGELPNEGVLIGRTRPDNDRVVLMKNGTRYLNKK